MTSQAIKFENRLYVDVGPADQKTTTVISQLPLAEMCALHNMVAEVFDRGRATKKFADKQSGLRRTWKIFQDWAKVNGQKAEKPKKAKPEPKSPAPKNPDDRRKRIMRFTFAPENDIRILRDTETLRGRCVVLLKKGATFAEVEELVVEFDKDRKLSAKNVIRRAYELVRIMHYYLGYGIKHDIETGIITLYTKK